jgi:hypothetical protein
MLHTERVAHLEGDVGEIVSDRVKLAEKIGPGGGSPLRAICGAKILHSIASGNEDGFAQAQHLFHLRKSVRQLRFAECDFFAQLDRCLLKV